MTDGIRKKLDETIAWALDRRVITGGAFFAKTLRERIEELLELGEKAGRDAQREEDREAIKSYADPFAMINKFDLIEHLKAEEHE